MKNNTVPQSSTAKSSCICLQKLTMSRMLPTDRGEVWSWAEVVSLGQVSQAL